GERIRMGLMQVKGMSEETADAVVRARGRKRFSSLEDFWRRTALDRDAVENLIAVGAFDTMGVNRRKLLWQLEEIARTVSRQRAPQQRNLVRYTGAPVPQLPALTELDVAGLDFTIQGAS